MFKKLNWFLCCNLVLFSFFSHAKYTIAVVGKTKNDSFYEQSFQGCINFAASLPKGILQCIYDGPMDYQDIRSQALVVESLLDRNIDALLVAVTDSNFLASHVLTKFKQRNIPVIAFDSDFLPEDQHHRLAYVGTNNFDFGKALGEYTKQYKRDNDITTVCIQSGHHTTPNLNQRIQGVRFALSGKTSRLDGSSGWLEHERCPLYSLGKRDVAINQVSWIVDQQPIPITIAVAGFAQFSPEYISTFAEKKSLFEKNNIVMISADSEPIQLDALRSGLSTVNIGQRPFDMGKRGAELLYDVLANNEVPEQSHIYLDFHYCTRDNIDTCKN
jgi:ribose transport system substrate-binding protein